MKKPILFIFALIPLLASCNRSENGFVNPFPNDSYEEKKIGFNFGADEKIKRILTTQEGELLDKTLDPINLNHINEFLLAQETGEIHERDYTRAFAGVYGEGYASSNMMHDETFTSFHQDSSNDLNERKKTMSNVTSTYDYSYGQNTTETTIKTLSYLAKKMESSYEYEEDKSNPECVIERKYEVIETEEAIDISAHIIASEESDFKKALHYSQSDYIFKPSTSDPVAGAFDDDKGKTHVIIIREQHDPSGEYTLPDGRAYKTAKNSLRVTSLVKKADNDPDVGIGDYYLVEKSRVYTETAITSDVIQPNVPITFLKNPIVINYKEEIHKFLTEKSAETSEDIITPTPVTPTENRR